MRKYVALLRGINVGGRSIVKMSDLKRTFVSAGCKQVSTYIQSGNVIFDAPQGEAATISRIQAKLCDLLGSDATVLFRYFRELEALVKRAPFKGIKAGADVKLYVTFLSRKPPGKSRLPLLSPKEGLEAFRMRNLEVFVVS